MKKYMTRLLSLTLVLVMVLGVMPVVHAANCGHNYWDEGKITKAATCSTKGERTLSCMMMVHSGGGYKRCSGTKTVVVDFDPNKHETGEWVVTTQPDCEKEKNGTKTLRCSGCKKSLSQTETIPWEHAYDDGIIDPEPTCKTPGTKTYTCFVCGNKKYDTIPAGGSAHAWDEGKVETAATCQKAGEMTLTCEECGATKTDPIPVDSTAHNYGADGKCVNKDAKNKVCGVERPNDYNLNAVADFTLKAFDSNNNTKTLSHTLKDGDTAVTTGVTITYASDDDDVATVGETSGKVTAVGVGTAVITVTAKVGNNTVATDSINVTVTDGFKITCEGIDVELGASETLSPKASFTPTTGEIEYSFAETDAEISVNATTGSVSGLRAGVAEVLITAEYKVGSTVVAEDSVEVAVSVYTDHTVYATLNDGVSLLDFADTGKLYEVKYDGTKYTKSELTNYSLGYFMSEGEWSRVTIVESPMAGAKDKIGTLSVGSYGNDYTNNFSFVTLTLNGTAGTAAYVYELTNSAGLLVATGTLYLTVSGSNNIVEYSTGMNKSVTVDEKDFYELWDDADFTRGLDYVVFDVDSLTPYYGDLYTTASSSTQKTVTYNMAFAYDATSADTYDLDAVTYVPSKYNTKAYVEEIPFTMYGLKSSEVLTGILVIKVGSKNPFTDVKEGDYFYDAVLWAVEEGVTTGQTETTFAPNAACTRAQVVTFLWRAAGEPTPKTTVNPFTDVKSNQYYYKAVLWAVEKGITTGLTATTFGPNAACTRAQVVTFLHRAAGEPSVTGFNSFTDVATNAYYYTPVLWAVKNDITNGMSATTFGSNSTCTRGQIVTFLYRYVVD